MGGPGTTDSPAGDDPVLSRYPTLRERDKGQCQLPSSVVLNLFYISPGVNLSQVKNHWPRWCNLLFERRGAKSFANDLVDRCVVITRAVF